VKIALFLAANDKAIIGIKSFLNSLLKNNAWFDKDIILLSDGGLSKNNINELIKLYRNIIIINAKKEDYLDCVPTTRLWGFNLYYRFDVFGLGSLGYDRIIMLDSDMIVTKDISELFDYTCSIGACKKYLGIKEIEPNNILAINRKRFNCGLISISKKFLDISIKNKLIELASTRAWSSDQPVLNLFFEKQITYLPEKFNLVSANATKESISSACILHYHGMIKPWESNTPELCFDKFIKEEISKSTSNPEEVLSLLKTTFDYYTN